MSTNERRIPFKVEFARILELFAAQIYQSPLALLRENTQNAFDAVLMKANNTSDYQPEIHVTVDGGKIEVSDNGIGMTSREMENNYWYAGRSGKNTAEARAAGVVGTFGIGAMANFGVASALTVESESASGERTRSSVRKEDLSTDFDSISLVPLAPIGSSGTTVTAQLAETNSVSIGDAQSYLTEFVRFVDVPVYFNETLISGAAPTSLLPSARYAWREFLPKQHLGIVTADIKVFGMATGELRVVIENLIWDFDSVRPGTIVLLQQRSGIQTLRSGFGLSAVALQSPYEWGGVVDVPVLKPTAGREALDTSSNQLLHQLVRAVDDVISESAAVHPESYSNDCFLRWVTTKGNYHLCHHLEVEPRPTRDRTTLGNLVSKSGLRYYAGRDENVVRTYASEEQPLVVLSRRSPRRDCELGYLQSKQIREVDTRPTVRSELPIAEQSIAQIGVGIRVGQILETDYFLPSDIRYGEISGDLPLLVQREAPPPTIFLNYESDALTTLFSLYEVDYAAFSPFAKDFVRSTVFPRISHLVPSSTKAGAEEFLRHLRSHREIFEYSGKDRGNLDEIFEELRAGRLTTVEAARRLVDMDRSTLDVSNANAAPLSSVVQDGPPEEMSLDPRPGIDRRDVETSARILTSPDSSVVGYNCFLSLTDRVHREKGDFFLQPHTTEVIWGGQKVVFVFQHHSGRFGLYYDILCPRVVGSSGGGRQMTASLIAKERTFIPVPAEIVEVFLPQAGEVVSLDVRCDILYLADDV